MNYFTEEAWTAFQEAAADKYDFTTCQRPDGSKYGSNGRCIKGSETSAASKDDKKKSTKKSGGRTKDVSKMDDKKLFEEAEASLKALRKGGSNERRARAYQRNRAAEEEMVKRGHLDKLSSWHNTGFNKDSAPGVK
jgi:hypothetical protein